MKRAQELIDAEEEDAEGSPDSMQVDADADAEEGAQSTGRSKVPPVPPLPSNIINGVGK